MTKCRFFSFFLLLLSCLGLYGQSGSIENPEKFKFGFRGGFSSNYVFGEFVNFKEINPRASIQLGFISEYFFTKILTIQPEIFYSGQGFIGVPLGFDEEVIYRFNYINMPILFKIYPFKKKKFNLEIGPQLGLLLSAKADYEFLDSKFDVSDQLKPIDFGLNYGLAYRFDEDYGVDLRYYQSSSNISDDDIFNTKNYNQFLSISIFLFFW